MVLLNMVWPALYVATQIWQFWYLVLVTILVETFTIKWMLKYPLLKSATASLIGNIVSGVVGTFVMIWLMLPWHALVDGLIHNGTFDLVNWIFTYILMCLGSVMIEVGVIHRIYKEPIKKLLMPLFVGNVLTYVFIGIYMANNSLL